MRTVMRGPAGQARRRKAASRTTTSLSVSTACSPVHAGIGSALIAFQQHRLVMTVGGMIHAGDAGALFEAHGGVNV